MKKLRTSIVLMMSLFITIHLSAQFRTLEGVVTDNNQNPLERVKVIPKGLDRSVTTDDAGYYRIEQVPDTIKTMVFTLRGMETASATIGIYDKIDISMEKLGTSAPVELSLEDLLNLEITTASKSSEKLSDAPGVVSVLTKDEINRLGGTTLKELLEAMPSLIGSTVYMTDRTTIAPRGDQIQPSSSHVLLLVNGRPVREALEGGIKSEMYEAFPVNIIEKIEVIRGPGSVLYGSNAFSAVINVITEKAEETNISVTAQAGVEGSYGGMAKAKIKAGDLDIVAAARYFEKQKWETDWQYATMTADTTVSVSIPNTSVGAYLDVNFRNIRFMSSYTQWENYYFIADYASVFPSYGTCTWKKGFGDLGYKLNILEKWDMNFNLTYTKSTFDVSSWPNINRDSYEITGEWMNSLNLANNLRINFGGLYNTIKGKEIIEAPEGDLTINDATRYSLGAFTQADYQILKQLKLIGGFQVNKVENIDIDFVPRGGIIIYPFDRLNIKLLYSQAFRAPSINELALQHPAMSGNPNLTPEKVNTVDAGINYQGKSFQVGTNYFFSKQMDIIIQDRSGKYPVPTYDNIGEIEIQGVEFEGRYYFNQSLLFTGSMLYQTNKDNSGAENVTPLPNFGAKAGVSYMERGICISLFDVFQGEPDDKYKTLLNPSPEAYHLVNLHIKYNFINLLKLTFANNLSLFLKVDNILDKEIWLTDWGLTPGKSIPVNQGREIYIGLDIGF
jgi:outer membrane receptor for ferrienterochelin and colicins